MKGVSCPTFEHHANPIPQSDELLQIMKRKEEKRKITNPLPCCRSSTLLCFMAEITFTRRSWVRSSSKNHQLKPSALDEAYVRKHANLTSMSVLVKLVASFRDDDQPLVCIGSPSLLSCADHNYIVTSSSCRTLRSSEHQEVHSSFSVIDTYCDCAFSFRLTND